MRAIMTFVAIVLLGGGAGAAPYSDAYRAAFEATLADPANVELLLDFAEIAVAEGDLEGAIAALERLLIAEGDAPEIEVELAALYLQIGALAPAQAYARAARRTPDAGLRARAEALLAVAERQAQQHRFGGGVSLGFGYRDNVNLAPNGASVTINDRTIELPPELRARPDGNGFAAGAVTHAVDLDRAMGLSLDSALAGSYAKQLEVSDYDLGTLGLAVGPRLRLGPVERGGTLWAFALGNVAWLGGSPYAVSVGGGAAMSAPLTDGLWADVVVEVSRRAYFDGETVASASGQTGLALRGSGQLRWRLFEHLWVSAGGHGQRTQARVETSASTSYGALVGVSVPFVSPLSAARRAGAIELMFRLDQTDYDASNLVLLPDVDRSETEHRYIVFATLPIGGHFGVYAAGNYADRRSPAPIYAYTALSTAGGVSYSF